MSASVPRVSVILSTFDRLDALRVVLDGYERSTFRDFEVIVADDGSDDATGEWVRARARGASYPLVHVYQEDAGFRLAAARNLAVRHAAGEILVFTDGDCIPYRDCLGVHATHCQPGRALAGGRCDSCEAEARALLAASDGRAVDAILARVRARELGRLRRLVVRNAVYRFTATKARPKLRTANAAVHRADFDRVNGFDERFVGWGYEDEDLARRLRASGVRVRDATVSSLVLHIFHPVHESHRPDARGSDNYRYYKAGAFLERPVRGIVRRDVRLLAVELVGALPEELLPLSQPRPRRPEVSVIFGQPRRVRPRPRGEIVLRVADPDETPSDVADLYRLLESRLARFHHRG